MVLGCYENDFMSPNYFDTGSQQGCYVSKLCGQKLADLFMLYVVYSGSGWPTGYEKKVSSSQAQLGQATCVAVV